MEKLKESNNIEFEIITNREKEMKERVKNTLLTDEYEEWDELLKVIELRHKMEVKAAYEKGIRKGAYYQRLIDCKEND